MGKNNYLLLLTALIVLCGQMLYAQEADKKEVDTRVWSRHYWENIVKTAPPHKIRNIEKQPAVFKGTRINSKYAKYIDSPDVPVTSDMDDYQSENSIFVSPLDNQVVLNSNNSSHTGGVYGASGYFTFDGAANWAGSEQPTGGANRGDPAAAIGNNGWFYNGYIAANSGQGAAYSTDNGTNWTHVQIADASSGGLLDKNHMWIDNSPSSPYDGQLYSAWTDLGSSSSSDYGNIMIARTTDNGLSWGSEQNISSAINAGSHNQGVNVQTGPNGEVYAAWTIYDSWPSDENAMGFAKSLDGGATWEAPVKIIENIRGIRNTETSKNMRVNSFPGFASDISNGPNRGNLYLVWANVGTPGENTGNDIDVYLIKSEDDGDNWSTPVKVNQDASGLGKEHYLPWITCDPETGDLHVIFYDDRNVSSTQCETFVASSYDGGETWEDYQVSDVAFTPAPIAGLASGYFGDYIGISARGGSVYPVWTDNRETEAMAYVSPYVVSDPTDPKPPVSISAYSDYTTPASINMAWTDPTELVNGDPLTNFQIEIYRGENYITAVASGIQVFTDTGLDDGLFYEYTLFTRNLDTDSLSYAAGTSFTAGGSPTPSAPTIIQVKGDTEGVTIIWQNPNKNIDNTPMDDFAGINLYQDGLLVETFTRTSEDTSVVDSAIFAPTTTGYYSWQVSAYDNEEPSNESALSNNAITPIGYPFSEDFEGDLGLFINNASNETNWTTNTTLYIEGVSSAHNAHGSDNDNIMTTIGSIDLSEAVNPKLSFYQICKTEGTYDFGYVEYSLDGTTWTSLPESSYEGEGTYTSARFHEDSYTDWGTSDVNPTNDWWKFEIFDLSSFVGEASFSLRFNLHSDGSANRYGWLIDAISIDEPNANPIMTVTPKILNDTLMIGGQNTVNFLIANDQLALSALNYTVTEETATNWMEATPGSGSVAQGSAENIAVNVNTTDLSPGDYSANLVVEGNDLGNQYDTITVNLNVQAAPEIVITQDTIRFSIDQDMTDSTSFYIKNTGDGILTISSITDEMMFKGNMFDLPQQLTSPEYEKGEQERTYPPMTKNTGGPDGYGYSWVDSDEPGGPAYNWIDISTIGINSGINDDELVSGPFEIGFDFNFYGQSYNQVYICENGWISFNDQTSGYYTNGRIPSSSSPNNILAPFWDDMNTTNSGDIFYYHDAANQRFIIQYKDVPRWNNESSVMNFQVIINASGSIKYQYQSVTGTVNSQTIGIENHDGNDGLEVVYNANYVHDDLAIIFSRGAGWLEYTDFTGNILPGDSVEIQLDFNTAGMTYGEYSTQIKIESNDPVNGFVENPVVIMTIEQQTGIEDLTGVVPQKYALHQNYPNPFNPTTTIQYDLKAAQNVTLVVYNLLGEKVRTLLSNKAQAASHHQIVWDARDDSGKKVSSGIYIYRIQTPDFVQSKKMLLLK